MSALAHILTRIPITLSLASVSINPNPCSDHNLFTDPNLDEGYGRENSRSRTVLLVTTRLLAVLAPLLEVVVCILVVSSNLDPNPKASHALQLKELSIAIRIRL